MTTMDELEQRIAALEERLGEEAGLRASQDRDLGSLAATLRAQHHTLQALAITQSEHNQKIDDLGERVNNFAVSNQRQLNRIVELLNRLIENEQ